MAVCDSVGTYILFATGSKAPTRTWPRAETSGRDVCALRSHEKLKYTVLKNPPSTVRGTSSCLTKRYTITIGSTIYAIDPVIYDALKDSLAASPVTTLGGLQERIAEVRLETNNPPPLSVQLKDVPITQYTKRYEYDSSTTETKLDAESTPTKSYDFPYIVGNMIDATFLLQQPALSEFAAQFGTNSDARFSKAQFVYVSSNSKCVKSTTIADFYPGGTADRFGTPILALLNLIQFRNTGVKNPYYPIIAYISAASSDTRNGTYPPKGGILFGLDNPSVLPNQTIKDLVAANSQLIFIPVQTKLEQISDILYPPRMGITILLTNGGDPTRFAETNRLVSLLAIHTSVNDKTTSGDGTITIGV